MVKIVLCTLVSDRFGEHSANATFRVGLLFILILKLLTVHLLARSRCYYFVIIVRSTNVKNAPFYQEINGADKLDFRPIGKSQFIVTVSN